MTDPRAPLFGLRHWARFIALLALLAACGATTLAARAYFTRGITDSPPAQPMANVPLNRFGVNTKLEQDVTESQLHRDVAAIKAAGFGWVRQEIQWNQLEPDRKGLFWDSKYDKSSWAKWDRIVSLVHQEGLHLILRIDRPPLWTHPELASLLAQHPDWEAPPDHLADYGDIVAAIVSRYRGKVDAVQLWNEPNLEGEWAGHPVDPAAYSKLLAVGAARARAADPHIVVVAAALAPTIEPGPRFGYANMSDLLFLQGMYNAGAASSFDVASVNPYGLQHGPTADETIGPSAFQFPRAALFPADAFDFARPITARAIMILKGDAQKPIWASEFGWNTVPLHWRGNPSPWGSVTPAQQARYLVQAYRRARHDWPWMGVMSVWYLREPVAVNPADPTPYFALLHPDWSPTPAYNAIKALATAPPRAYTGSHRPTTPAAQYGFAGAWRAVLSPDHRWRYQIAGAPQAHLTFDFSGSVLSVIVRDAPNGGRAFVHIDGSPSLANELPTDAAGNAYLDLYAPTVINVVRKEIARGLPDGPHQLTMVIEGAKNPRSAGTDLAIGAFIVGQLPWSGWSYLLGLDALAVAILLTWPATVALRTATIRLRRGASGRWRASVTPRLPAALTPDTAVLLCAAAAEAVYYVAPWPALSLTMLALFGLVALFRLDVALLLVIPLAPLAFLPKHLGQIEFAPAETTIVVCIAAWLVRGYWRGAMEVRWGRFARAALVLVALGVLSLGASRYLRFSLRELRLVIVEPALWFIMLQSVLPPRRRWLVVDLLVGTAVAVSLLGLIGLVTGHSVIATQGVRRVASIYPSPDNLALLLDRIAPIAAAVAIFGVGQRRRWYTVAAMLIGLTVLLTFSRGAWIALFAAGLVLGLRRRLIAGVVAVGLMLLLLAPELLHITRFSLVGPTATERLLLWQAAVAMVRDHPLFGIGLDQFLYTYPRYRLAAAWREPFLSHPHNVVLDFWLQLGLPGLFWAGWMLVEVGRRLIGLTRKLPGADRALAWGLLASFTAIVVHGMVDDAFFEQDLAIVFWTEVILVWYLLAQTPRPTAPPVSEPVSGRS